MGKLIYTLSVVACLLSCAKGYKIVGTSSIQDFNGKTITLKASDGNTWHVLDSCEVLHGQFVMKGKIDSTLLTTLFIDDQPMMPMVLESGKIGITVSNIMLKAEGTPLNDSLYKFIAHKYKLDLRVFGLEHTEAQMIMNGYDEATIQRHIDSTYMTLRNEMHSLVLDFIGKNYDNVLSICGFSMLCNGLPYPTITPLIQAVIDDAPETFLTHPIISSYLDIAHENTEHYGVADANY